MKRLTPWLFTTIAVVAFAASFLELQRMRKRFGEVTRHQFHDHQDVRYFMIRTALNGLDRPIVFLGDSNTEMLSLPSNIAGKPVVNAGIGGATIAGINAAALLSGFSPSMIVVALGTNDRGSPNVQKDYSALLSQLKKLSPNILAVAVIPIEGSSGVNQQIRAAVQTEDVRLIEAILPDGSILEDGIHLSPVGQRVWMEAILAAITAGLGSRREPLIPTL